MTDLRDEFETAVYELNVAYAGYDAGCYDYEDIIIADLQRKIDGIIKSVKNSGNAELMNYINNELRNNFNLSYRKIYND